MYNVDPRFLQLVNKYYLPRNMKLFLMKCLGYSMYITILDKLITPSVKLIIPSGSYLTLYHTSR